MKKISEFSFKVRLTPKRSLIAIAVASSLAFLTTQCNLQKEDILKLYNKIRKILPIGRNEFLREFDNQLNERIIKDPKLLDYKVRGEVDYAIYNYEREEQKNRTINMKNKNILEEINKDKYNQLQKLIVENAVYYEFADGTMGIRSAWVDPDPREVDLEN
jgi:hypothetical protein